MISRPFCSLLLFLAQATTGMPPTQVSPAKPPDVPTPSDAQQRMALAARVNGLLGLDIPWHVRASYEVYSPDGASREKGTYEEWRISDKRYKIALKSPSRSVMEFRNEQGLFSSGGEWPLQPLSEIQAKLEHPVRWPNGPQPNLLENYDRTSAGKKISCTAWRAAPQQDREAAASFCFAPSNAILVLSTGLSSDFQTLFEDVSLVHGQYFANDVRQFLFGKPWLAIHVEHLEGISQSFLSSFSVPPDAVPVPLRLPAAGGISSPPRLLNKMPPAYPADAKWKRIQGIVLVNGVIDTDGRVKALEVLTGPPALQDAALEAVRHWTYSPTLVDGKPVEVELTARVEFRL
jgi:TonB family protein